MELYPSLNHRFFIFFVFDYSFNKLHQKSASKSLNFYYFSKFIVFQTPTLPPGMGPGPALKVKTAQIGGFELLS